MKITITITLKGSERDVNEVNSILYDNVSTMCSDGGRRIHV